MPEVCAPAPQPVTAVTTWLSALTSDTSASGARNAFAAHRVRRSSAALAKTSSAGSEASPLRCGPMIDLASTRHCIGRRVHRLEPRKEIVIHAKRVVYGRRSGRDERWSTLAHVIEQLVVQIEARFADAQRDMSDPEIFGD